MSREVKEEIKEFISGGNFELRSEAKMIVNEGVIMRNAK